MGNHVHRREQWLSLGLESLIAEQSRVAAPIDVLIIGSGYGAAVAADRLTQAMQASGRRGRVVLLERGREYLPGAFPATEAELAGHLRFTTPLSRQAQGRREGLFDVRVGRDMHVVLANGLGGGSLTNAGVMEPPHAAVWAESAWPQQLRDPQQMQQRLLAMQQRLMARPLPPERQAARTRMMTALGGKPVAITVAHQASPYTASGVPLQACLHCGDCASGCNHGAKISLDVGPLKAAFDRGLQIYCGATVSRIRRAANGLWQAQVWHTDATLRGRMAHGLWLSARHVILAAGTLGSTEILLRSQSPQLRLSAQLGRRFSGNGDVLAAVMDCDQPLHGVADEEQDYAQRHVGPTITAMLDARSGQDSPQTPQPDDPDLVVQDLGVPAALSRLFAEGLTSSGLLHAMERTDASTITAASPDPCAVDAGRLARSISVAMMVRDDANGVLQAIEDDPEFPNDAGVRIDWPTARHDPRLRAAHRWLQHTLDRSGQPGSGINTSTGTVLPNPIWQLLPDKLGAMLGQRTGPLLSVHPLGGCAMADSRQHGVVDAHGRVFDGADDRRDTDIHAGLYVLDGAIVPTSLGINPALTIATLVDLAMDALLPELLQQMTINDVATTPSPDKRKPSSIERPIYAWPSAPAKRRDTQVQVIERLAGTVDLTLNGVPLNNLWVELDLVYQPQALLPRDGADPEQGPQWAPPAQTLHVAPDPQLSRLRIFPAPIRGPRYGPDLDDRHAWLIAPLAEASTLRFLHREPSSLAQRRWRALPAWWSHRGARDCWQRLENSTRLSLQNLLRKLIPHQPHDAPDASANHLEPAAPNIGAWQRLQQAWRLASHAGAARRFDYDLRLLTPTQLRGPMQALQGRGDLVLRGHKRLIYQRGANPLTQLCRMRLDAFGPVQDPANGPAIGAECAPESAPERTFKRAAKRLSAPQAAPGHVSIQLGTRRHLDLDLAHLAAKRMPLLRVVGHQNQPTAIFDLASFGLYLTRVLVHHHLWSLRKPDPARPAWLPSWRPRQQPQQQTHRPACGLADAPQRLPGALRGLPAPVIVQLHPAGPHDGVIRLTHYPHQAARAQGRVVLMVHGYSASGTTFAHPTVQPNLAGWLHQQGYEPWIVDLRTSCGMPTATQPWSFEHIATHDLPTAINAVCDATGQADIHLFTHCMGSAMLTLLLQTPGTPATQPALGVLKKLRSWTMSQVGPRLVYAPGNQLRIMLLDSYRHLLRGPVDLTAGDDRGTAGALAANLIDRLVAALPYGDALSQHPSDSQTTEFALESPPPWRFWQRTRWVRTRHRLDALIGRTFDARQMRPQTLARIDDFFGPFNLATMVEPMAYQRYGKIVRSGQGKDGEAPDLDCGLRLRGVPMLSLHGARNGLADPHTAELLQTWRHQYGLDLRSQVFAQHGHQDLLIGRDCRPVFQCVTDFLRQVDQRPQRTSRSSSGRTVEGNGCSDDRDVNTVTTLHPADPIYGWHQTGTQARHTSMRELQR